MAREGISFITGILIMSLLGGGWPRLHHTSYTRYDERSWKNA